MSHTFQEFGGTAFIIDGKIPEQVSRMVEIQQIIDDIVIIKCIPGGGIAVRKTCDLFESKYAADETIKHNLLMKRRNDAAEIADINTLVRFALTHNIGPGDANRLERETFIEQACKLGIDLGDIVK